MKSRTLLNILALSSCFAFAFKKDNALKTATITTVTTFQSISLELPFTGDANQNATCDVVFRKKGTREWRKGLRLFNDYLTDKIGFRGSLVLLNPDTEYEIKLTYHDSDGGSGEKVAFAKTWSEHFAEGKVTKVNDSKSFKVISGTENNYHVYDGGKSKTLVNANNEPFCVDLEGASYVILRNLRFTGSDQHALNIKNANHIIVENCEIFEWGRPGTFCQKDGKGRRDGAIYVETCSEIVIQNNRIHNPRGNTCDWRIAHPNGPRGIYLNNIVNHSVFRYNSISGSENHYYDDVITGDTDGSGDDLDIYGNLISHAWDDGIEIEGPNKNVRVWGNVVKNVFQAIASDNNTKNMYYGPVYIWRNIFTDLYYYPTPKSSGNGFKLENSLGHGHIYIFNNTLLGAGNHLKPNGGISNGPQFNMTLLNNIFDINKDNFHDNKTQDNVIFDYNAYSGSNKLFTGKELEKNGLFNQKFTFSQKKEWVFSPVKGSSTIDAGVIIPNFSDDFKGKAPDMGAIENGVYEMKVGPQN
ncbi:right-handed parallel beta-helix repeat-containing protein [Daejeonella sp.]|uniref:right-handed parallel beta-helix repeat-containing protein n=1 Tax=Daejeonella sp. TaxID=2805397 RepID=UPI0030BD3860